MRAGLCGLPGTDGHDQPSALSPAPISPGPPVPISPQPQAPTSSCQSRPGPLPYLRASSSRPTNVSSVASGGHANRTGV